MMDEMKLDALERATIAMCDCEVIFQILIDKGITTREEILLWRETMSYKDPYYKLFYNLEEMKRMLREEQAELNPPAQPTKEDSKEINNKSLLRNFNKMKLRRS